MKTLAELIREAAEKGLIHAEDEPRKKNRTNRGPFDGPEGYQYGIKYQDGSVWAKWSGRTQLARAYEELVNLRTQHPYGTFFLVRRPSETDAWKSFTLTPKLIDSMMSTVRNSLARSHLANYVTSTPNSQVINIHLP